VRKKQGAGEMLERHCYLVSKWVVFMIKGEVHHMSEKSWKKGWRNLVKPTGSTSGETDTCIKEETKGESAYMRERKKESKSPICVKEGETKGPVSPR